MKSTIINRVVRKPKSKKETHYVNNKDLFVAMQAHYDLMQKSNSKDVQISNYIGLAILTICENLAKKANFSGYTWREDMVSEGIKDCVKAVNGFKPHKYDNPFGYFTMIAFNAFVRVILSEKKQTYIKHKNFQQMSMGDLVLDEANEMSDDVIQQFEDKAKRDKAKKKNKPVVANKKVKKNVPTE